MKKLHIILIAALLGSNTVMAADSVYEWGSWQAEDDVVAAILAGADPTEVTSAPAAGPSAKGTVVQPIIPVALDNRFITQGDMPKEFEVIQVITPPPPVPDNGNPLNLGPAFDPSNFGPR